MKIISHRGNIHGPDPEHENEPSYIISASRLYDVEIDVWVINDEIYLGHDEPQYKISKEFLLCGEYKHKLWCHAKNLEALNMLLSLNMICFWHQEDDRVLTSNNYIWTYPGKELCNISIAVMPERCKEWNIDKCYAICTDYCSSY